MASLLGSVHCLAMCGPLVTLAAGRSSFRFAVVHSLGRLATYVTLGALAGAVGKALDLAGHLVTVQHAAALIAALAIVATGGYAIASARGWFRRGDARTRGTLFRSAFTQIRSRRPSLRAAITGALTGLLPCGWLWAFLVSAGGTGSAASGAAVMAVFWLGTVPAMTGGLALVGPLVERLRARMPVVTAVALVSLGLGTLAVRWDNAGAAGIQHPTCHHAAAR
ncbi:MAG TPA: sulfite exporter TauE/SafE family protein [Kofleriaceae bacterium]